MYNYSQAYLEHLSHGSFRLAQVVLPIVRSLFDVTSVADFGCGTGAWVEAWHRLGVRDAIGCDGPYVAASTLRFEPARFVAADLTQPIRLGRRFDLVQSLEVAEHLPADTAATFVETLVSHGAVILFSAAAPGQGGEHHVNEQPLEYWRALFRRCGFQAVDAVRPRLAGNSRVAPWYRYNSLVYVEQSQLRRLEASLRAQAVPDGTRLRNYAPLATRACQRLLAHVPERIVTRVAAGLRQLAIR